MNDSPSAQGMPDRLPPGTRVEVRNDFDGSWTRGFTIADVSPEGYRIHRRSDGTRIPTVFSPEQVRRERTRSTWWV